MNRIFLTVLNMSLTASYVILCVTVVRLFLKKAPKFISYALWGVVAFRLIVPFSFESMFSLMPRNADTVPIPHEIIYQQTPQINSGIEAVDTFENNSLPAPTVEASTNPLQIYVEIGAYIWVLGIITLLTYSLVSVLKLKRQLKSAKLIEQNIYQAENLKTPFVLGLIRPRIYLPAGLNDTERSYILIHEKTHIRRNDHIIKVLAFIILSIHWFNPLVWIAFRLMTTDMELSCDERVLKEMKEDIKKPYANLLLSLAAGRHFLNGSPLAFGEGNVKGRIKNVLNYKRPRFWVITAAVIVVCIVTIGFASNPRSIAPSMMWAKSLRVEDIQSIEFIAYPSSENNEYKKFKPEEFAEIVELINQSNGRLIDKPKDITANMQTFYVTTKDGTVHKFTNSGNTYLIIDGDTFMASYDWLSKWDYRGDSNVPEEFGERYDLRISSYELMQLRHGEVQRKISPLTEDNAKITEAIIMNYMVKSAAWPGIDINALEECYVIRVNYSDGTISDYYAFINDGKAVMQWGINGYYSILSDGFYEQLVQLLNSDKTAVDVIDEGNKTKGVDSMPGFTEEEVAAARAVVEEYFRAIKEKDDEAIIKTLNPQYDHSHSVLYGDEIRTLLSIEYNEDDPMRKSYIESGKGRSNGTEIENVIVFRVNFNVKYPEGASGAFNEGDYVDWNMILIRENKESPWFIDDQGY